MPYRSLSDEQILILRGAVSNVQLDRGSESQALRDDDLKVLTALGLIEVVDLDVLVTEEGARMLDAVDRAWASETRKRNPTC